MTRIVDDAEVAAATGTPWVMGAMLADWCMPTPDAMPKDMSEKAEEARRADESSEEAGAATEEEAAEEGDEELARMRRELAEGLEALEQLRLVALAALIDEAVPRRLELERVLMLVKH